MARQYPIKALYTTTGMQMIPYRPTLCKSILNSRSVWTNAAHSYTPVTAYVMKDDNERRLCTYNCHPTWLQANFPGIEIETMPKNDAFPLDKPFTLNIDIIPTEIQSAVVSTIVDNDFKQAFFNIPTGVGKTLLSIYLMSIIDTKAWAMCYRTIVLDQWKKTAETMTTFDSERIHIVRSSKELYRMATGDFDSSLYDLYLSTPMLLTKFATKYGLELLNDAMNFCGIGMKFFDEAHYNVGNICKINALTNIERTYYLSADFGQSDPNRELLYYKMFNRIPVIRPREDLVKSMQYTVGVIAHYDSHPTLIETESVFSKYGFNGFRYMEYQLAQPEFHDALQYVLESTQKSNLDGDYKILILCNLIKHVDQLFETLKNKYHELYGDKSPKIVRYHSMMDKEERSDALISGEIIVSTYQSMGVGVDLKSIRYVLSLSPVNSIEDNQAAGRARALPGGEDCFYFIFCDDGFEYVRKRLPRRLGYLQEHKIKKIYSIKYS